MTPAGRSRQPRTNTRKCGNQSADQSLLNRRLDGPVSGYAQARRRPAAGKKYRAHLVELRSFFEIISSCIYPLQRPENVKQSLSHCYVGTGNQARKRPPKWSHLALRKPATSRAVAGSYGGRIAFLPGCCRIQGIRARVSNAVVQRRVGRSRSKASSATAIMR